MILKPTAIYRERRGVVRGLKGVVRGQRGVVRPNATSESPDPGVYYDILSPDGTDRLIRPATDSTTQFLIAPDSNWYDVQPA